MKTIQIIAICEFNHRNFQVMFELRFDGNDKNEFISTEPSKCSHDLTFGIAVYNGSALTTGSYYNSEQSSPRTKILN